MKGRIIIVAVLLVLLVVPCMAEEIKLVDSFFGNGYVSYGVQGNGNDAPLQGVYFYDISKYQDLTALVISSTYAVYGSLPDWVSDTCSVTYKIGDVTVGTGEATFTNVFQYGSVHHTMCVLEFDTWDASAYSGTQRLDFVFANDTHTNRIWSQGSNALTPYGWSSVSISEGGTSSDKICLRSKGGFGLAPYHSSIIPVMSGTLRQTINYEIGSISAHLYMDKNGYGNLVTVTGGSGSTLYFSSSVETIDMTVYDLPFVIEVEKVYSEGTWKYTIPPDYQYNDNPVVPSVPENILNITDYRKTIIELPIIGNMTVPYLDFVDDMYTDGHSLGVSVIDTLMYPVNIVNENMVKVLDSLDGLIDGIEDSFVLITAPMVKIVTAIPEKVMGVFIFALALDIVRVLLAGGI